MGQEYQMVCEMK